jgi:hypothetical protein
MNSREQTKGNKMKTSREQIELEYLKAQADFIDQKIDLWNDRLGPSDEHVVKLKNELKSVNERILMLMVMDQEERLNKAVIA